MIDEDDLLIGRTLGGRYKITSRFNRGGMSKLYLAQDHRLSRMVAVKVIRSDLAEDPGFVGRFDREARAAAMLNHPNVVAIFDQGSENGRPYIVMEYIEGCSLRDLISQEAPMAPSRVLELAEPIVAALAAAHAAGIIHRDIKPENVLISLRGEVKVVDFGLARSVGARSQTQTGTLVGTAAYLPPELIQNTPADARVDIYSTGVMLFEMLTGRKPHTGETSYQVAYAHATVDIPTPSKALADAGIHLNWTIPSYLDDLIFACTRRNRESRPANGQVLLKKLREVRQKLNPTQITDSSSSATKINEDHTATENIEVCVPSQSPQTMQRAPHQVNTVWHVVPRSKTIPKSSPTPVSQRTPMLSTARFSKKPIYVKRRRRLVLLASILLVAILAASGCWWFLVGRYTTTPAMVNLNIATAKDLANQADLRVNFEKEFSETVAAGLITRTDPPPGKDIIRGGAIKAWLSLGPERYEMPPVTGLSKADAKNAVQRANLLVGKVTEAYSDTVATGIVIDASQPKGTKLKKSTPINLVVSKGPEPISISDYTGQDAKPAIKALTELGFDVKSTQANHRTILAGKIISQEPKSSTGKRGDTIKVVISKGPVMVAIPNVRSMSRGKAIQTLKVLGFAVEIKENSGPFQLGLAAGTTPEAGSTAPEGSTVTLHIV